jgi:hypothetical protein
MRFLVKLFLLILLNLSAFNVFAGGGASPPCAATGSANDPITFPIDNTLSPPTQNCYTTPDVYRINLYEIGLCNNISLSPTQLPDTNNTTNCTKLFYSANPVSMDITSALTPTAIADGFVNPVSGSYSFGYVKMTNRISSQLTKTFTSPYVGDNNLQSGFTCWTINNEYENGTMKRTTDCGSSANPGFLIRKVTNVTCGYGDGAPYFCDNGTGKSKVYVAFKGTPDILKAYPDWHGDVVALDTANGTADELIVFYNFANPIQVTQSSTLTVLFDITNTDKLQYSSDGTPGHIGVKEGTFDLKFVTQ